MRLISMLDVRVTGVKSGEFGACLMAKPKLVADCIKSMKDSVNIPVTVKCRTGIDNLDSQSRLLEFIDTISSAGCKTFIIHARKAILNGLTPKGKQGNTTAKLSKGLCCKGNVSRFRNCY